MKELSIEEKAKRYDEAVINGSRLWECGEITRENYEYIFPELKEGEDERIRKWIRKELESKYVVDNIVNNVMADKALAWLEKQGQVKESLISHHENKTCKESDDSLTSEDIRKGLIQYFSTFTLDTFAGLDPKKILSWLEKQGEHENGFLQELDDKLNNTLGNETPGSLKKFLNEQNPAWSEEDDKIIEEILNDIECARVINYHTPIEDYEFRENWLKSLKDRCIPQSKQEEWSEDDEKTIIQIEDAVVNYFPTAVADKINNWIKSFKDRVQPL